MCDVAKIGPLHYHRPAGSVIPVIYDIGAHWNNTHKNALHTKTHSNQDNHDYFEVTIASPRPQVVYGCLSTMYTTDFVYSYCVFVAGRNSSQLDKKKVTIDSHSADIHLV